MKTLIAAIIREYGFPEAQLDADLRTQIDRLAEVLIHEFPDAFKTTDGAEGAVDMAIRWLREQAALLALMERALDKAIDCNNLLFKRVSPSHSSYWPTVNAYREATDELLRALNAVKVVTTAAAVKGNA